MPVRERTPILLTVGLLLGAGCEPSTQARKPVEMTPIGTWQSVQRSTPDDTSDGGVTSPNSGTPLPGSGGPCAGADLDNLEEVLRQCEATMPRAGEVSALKDKLEVKIAPATARVAPGARVAVEITLRNRTSEPLSLWFTGDPAPRFDLEAVDAKGRRADLPATRWPGYPKGQKPETRETRAAKVTLDRNGTAKLHLSWDAVKTKWSPQSTRTWEGRGYPRVPAGPLPAGKYLLRAVLPLLGDLDVAKVSIEVGS